MNTFGGTYELPPKSASVGMRNVYWFAYANMGFMAGLAGILVAARAKGIYRADQASVVKKSNENPTVTALYEGMLKGKEHELLHIIYPDHKI